METTPVSIWTGGACAGPPGYGYGGWAYLIVQGASVRGAAGGERHTTAARMGLRAVIEALRAIADQPAAPIQLDPGSAGLARALADLAAAPAEDADLWAEVATAAGRTGPPSFVTEPPPARSDARVFVDAWTAFAVDKTKTKGVFTAAIPKPNLQTFMAKRGPSSPSSQRARA